MKITLTSFLSIVKGLCKLGIPFALVALKSLFIVYSHIYRIVNYFNPVYKHLGTIFGITMFTKLVWHNCPHLNIQRGYLKRKMKMARTFTEWKRLADLFDSNIRVYNDDFGKAPSAIASKAVKGSNAHAYDRQLVQNKLLQLQRIQSSTNIKECINLLRFDLTRNFANLSKAKLQNYYTNTPNIVNKYIQSVKEQLLDISLSNDLSHDEKVKFFSDTRQTFGRTALLLSGGASLGTFHMGVVKALFEHKLLPRIISGSSVGSIVASIVCVRDDDDLLETFQHIQNLDLEFFSEHRTVQLLSNVVQHGHAHDSDFLIRKLRNVLGDTTFQEAYEKTGRILNITVCPSLTNEAPRILNYMTAPNVLIWSAVAASSAFPGLFPSQYIYVKDCNGSIFSIERKWRDGSIEMDLPFGMLAEMFNCNYFIVSQCNPMVIPFLNAVNTGGDSFIGKFLEAELKHCVKRIQRVLPNGEVKKLLNMFTQPWEGDVTITLPNVFLNLYNIVTNPNVQSILQSVSLGDKMTWPSLWAIECNCSIELCLDEIMKKLCGGCASWGVAVEGTYENLDCISV